jgi:hypothetical protein
MKLRSALPLTLAVSRRERGCRRPLQPLLRHPPHRSIGYFIVRDFHDRAPRQRMRLVADDERFILSGTHHVANVEVPVLRISAARRNTVEIEVEETGFDAQSIEPRLLFGFAQGDPLKVLLAIGMTTQLQPEPKLSMMRQQHARPILTHQPRRSGEVSDREFPLERIRIPRKKLLEGRDRRFLRPAMTILGQGEGKRAAFVIHVKPSLKRRDDRIAAEPSRRL